MKEFSERTAPGAYLADTLPPISDIIPVPLQWWRKSALQSYQRQERIWLKYWNTLQLQMQEGKAPECFVKQWAETDYKKQGIDETQAAFVAGSKFLHCPLKAPETDRDHSHDRSRLRDNQLGLEQRHPISGRVP